MVGLRHVFLALSIGLALLAAGEVAVRSEKTIGLPIASPSAPVSAPIADAPPTAVNPTPLALSTEEIVRRSDVSIALVRGTHLSGTGFLVRPGVLVTNAHVVAEPLATLRASFASAPPGRGGERPARLLWEDLGRDLAILAVDTDLPTLGLAVPYTFRRGQEITVIGNPGFSSGGTLVNAVSRGVLSTMCLYGGRDFYQLSVAINPGNSGGPVIGSDGRVIGVVTLKDDSRESMAFCVPAPSVRGALERLDRQTPAELRALHARHESRTVIERLDAAARTYSAMIGAFVTALNKARGERADASVVADELRRVSYPDVRAFHKTTIGEIYPILTRVLADPDLPDGIRSNLNDLWSNFLRLKAIAETVNGEGPTLRGRAAPVEARHDALIAALRKQFGLQ